MIQILNWQPGQRPRIWRGNQQRLAATLYCVAAIRAVRHAEFTTFEAKDIFVKKYLTNRNITAVAGMAVLCALALLSVSIAPAIAATMSRGPDVTAMLSAMWSMIDPLAAIRHWLPPRTAEFIRLMPTLSGR